MLSEDTNGYMYIQIKSFNVVIDVEALNLLGTLLFMVRGNSGSFIT